MAFLLKETALMWTGMLISFQLSVNYSFIAPFYPPMASNRGISPLWYSLIGGLGDGMYILTLFCNKIVSI